MFATKESLASALFTEEALANTVVVSETMTALTHPPSCAWQTIFVMPRAFSVPKDQCQFLAVQAAGLQRGFSVCPSVIDMLL